MIIEVKILRLDFTGPCVLGQEDMMTVLKADDFLKLIRLEIYFYDTEIFFFWPSVGSYY